MKIPIKTLGTLCAIVMGLMITAGNAKASNLNVMSDKVDELELEADVEDMEAYGDNALIEENKRETARLAQETNNLEREINKLKRESQKADAQKSYLQDLYKRRDKLAQDARKRAEESKRIEARAKANVDRLRARVEARERAAAQSVTMRKEAENEVVRQVRAERDLKIRLANAKKVIAKNEWRRKQAMLKAKKAARNNRKFEKTVIQKERKAIKTASRY
jgi:hypothetical protein